MCAWVWSFESRSENEKTSIQIHSLLIKLFISVSKKNLQKAQFVMMMMMTTRMKSTLVTRSNRSVNSSNRLKRYYRGIMHEQFTVNAKHLVRRGREGEECRMTK